MTPSTPHNRARQDPATHKERLLAAAKRRGIYVKQDGNVWRFIGESCDIKAVDLSLVRVADLQAPWREGQR